MTRRRLLLLLATFAAIGLIVSTSNGEASPREAAIRYAVVFSLALLVSFTVVNSPPINSRIRAWGGQRHERDFQALGIAIGVVLSVALLRISSEFGRATVLGAFIGTFLPVMYTVAPKR